MCASLTSSARFAPLWSLIAFTLVFQKSVIDMHQNRSDIAKLFIIFGSFKHSLYVLWIYLEILNEAFALIDLYIIEFGQKVVTES